jgi:hypothetical protein
VIFWFDGKKALKFTMIPAVVEAFDRQRAKARYQHFGFVSLPSYEPELFVPVATIQEALAQEG